MLPFSIEPSTIVLLNSLFICLALALYVALDGFDLGIGIVMPFLRKAELRRLAFSTLLPVWDMNETWLVFVVASLYVAFPAIAFSVLPGFYLPVMLLIFGLVARGCCIEFLAKEDAPNRRLVLERVFFASSAFTSFVQGAVLGTLVKGFYIDGGVVQGGEFQWISVISILSGVAVVFAYGILGSSWLSFRIRERDGGGELPRINRILFWLLSAAFLIIFADLALQHPENLSYVASSSIRLGITLALLALQCLTGFLFYRNTAAYNASTFVFAALSVLCGVLVLVASRYPFVLIGIDGALDIWQTSAVHASSYFYFIVSCCTMPLAIAYTAYLYKVFLSSGKVHCGNEITY